MAQPGRDASVKTRDLRSSLAEVLGQVERGGRVVVEKYNDPVAAIVPMSDYLTLRRLCATRAHPSDKEPRMAHRIVTSNISGGEGKTSITRELALTLADQGYRVAIIDTDPQGSLTKNLGLHDPVEGVARADLPGYRREHTILSVFDEDTEPRLGPPVQVLGVDVWVSNDALYEVDQRIGADLTKMGNLREAVDHIADRYDFILIDTKPGITPLLNAAVAAADHLIVPISGDKGFENLDISEARWTELGFDKKFTHPVKVTCADHEGNGPILIQQWDGKSWKIVSDWIPPMRDVVRPMIEESATKFATESKIEARKDCK